LSEKTKSRKLSRELAAIPIERYRMWKDGRKWKAVAGERMSLAEFLGNHADGDGSRIYPSLQSMMRKFRWSNGKVCYLLDDLRELRLLEDTPNYSGPQFHRTRIRKMNLDVFLAMPSYDDMAKLFDEAMAEEIQQSFDLALAQDAEHVKATSGLQDSDFQDSKIEQESKIQDSKIETQDSNIQNQESKIQEQDSKIEVQESKIGGFLDTTVTKTVTQTVTTQTVTSEEPPPLPPIEKTDGGHDGEVFYSWHKQIVAIRMRRHRRIPRLDSYVSRDAQIVCDFLNQRGFSARVVSETIVMPDRLIRLDPETRMEKNMRVLGIQFITPDFGPIKPRDPEVQKEIEEIARVHGFLPDDTKK
jgi:hypothetical protein